MRTTGSLLFTALIGVALSVSAHAEVPEAPTFSKDVLPIIQENCQDCHRPFTKGTGGMVAPMSLMTYAEVRPWSKAIMKAVSNREMPPWFATEEFDGHFRNESRLTQDEIDTITKWVETGAKRGNPKDAPEARTWPDSEWWNGDPDLIVSLPEPVWVPDEIQDWQPDIFVELGEDVLPEDRWIKGLEAQGGSEVVHHIVIFKADAAKGDSRNGFSDVNIGGLAPGAESTLMDEGYGIPLEKGTTLRFNMHYNKEPGPGTGTWDQSRIGLYFADEEEAKNINEVLIEPVGSFTFEIPPGHGSWVVGMAEVFDRPFTIHSMLPHMHLRGIAAEYTAFYPDGTSEKLLDIPEYDYNWQLYYRYDEKRQMPAGTRIEVKMTFDNSTANASNPDPDKPIRFGLETQDEMALGWMTWSWDEGEAATD